MASESGEEAARDGLISSHGSILACPERASRRVGERAAPHPEASGARRGTPTTAPRDLVRPLPWDRVPDEVPVAHKHSKVVLIVDDEEVFLASLLDGLAAYADEFTVLSAGDGETALRILATNPVDLVVTDLRMPRTDGFELLAELRRRNPETAAIVMSAIGSPAVEERLRGLGPLTILDKPVDFDQLLGGIRRALHLPPLAGESRRHRISSRRWVEGLRAAVQRHWMRLRSAAHPIRREPPAAGLKGINRRP